MGAFNIGRRSRYIQPGTGDDFGEASQLALVISPRLTGPELPRCPQAPFRIWSQHA